MPGKITATVVFLLTLVVVLFFVYATPENGLESGEIGIVVAIWGAAVTGVMWVGRSLGKKTATPEGESK